MVIKPINPGCRFSFVAQINASIFVPQTHREHSLATDEAAPEEAIGAIKSEGVHAFIGPHSA